jgi:isoquinoline 1-oxidoreductase beta subunit
MQAALDKTGAESVNKIGDPDPVLASATKVISATYETPFLSHATMEPMNCTASVKGDIIEVWSPTQFPDWAARAVAKACGTDIQKVQVHVTLMGGGCSSRSRWCGPVRTTSATISTAPARPTTWMPR